MNSYPCIVCDHESIVAPNVFNTLQVMHKIPSPRLEGYYTYTSECQN
jgi:hypothetical protein